MKVVGLVLAVTVNKPNYWELASLRFPSMARKEMDVEGGAIGGRSELEFELGQPTAMSSLASGLMLWLRCPGSGLLRSVTAARHTEAWGLKRAGVPLLRLLLLRFSCGCASACEGSLRLEKYMTHKRVYGPYTTLGFSEQRRKSRKP